MRLTNIVAWVVLLSSFLALCFLGFHTFSVRLETGDNFPEYSTYRADPRGLKALYQSLQSTDLIHASRRLQSSKILPSGEDQLLVVAGVRADLQTVSEEDSQLFDHWLATGGRLIIALRPEKIRTTNGAPSPRREEKTATDDTSTFLWRTLIRRWGAEIEPLNDLRSTKVSSTQFGNISRWLGQNSFTGLTVDWKVIAVEGEKNVIVERAFGHGSVVLLADSYPLSNEALAGDRNTRFLLWLINDRPGILFEETHLGLSEQPGIMALAQRYGLQGTFISMVAVLLLFIWKCQYTLVPRTKNRENGLTISGGSSDQMFLNLLQRTVSPKDLLGVCLTIWLKTVRPTPAQLARLEKFHSDADEKKSVVERYNQLTNLLNEEL